MLSHVAGPGTAADPGDDLVPIVGGEQLHPPLRAGPLLVVGPDRGLGHVEFGGQLLDGDPVGDGLGDVAALGGVRNGVLERGAAHGRTISPLAVERWRAARRGGSVVEFRDGARLIFRCFAFHLRLDPVDVCAVVGRESCAAVIEAGHAANGTGGHGAVSVAGRSVRGVGLSRDVLRVELSMRTAGPGDGVAPDGYPLWVVTWVKREPVGRDVRTWSAPHVTETGARRMARNLMQELAPGIDPAEAFTDRTG